MTEEQAVEGGSERPTPRARRPDERKEPKTIYLENRDKEAWERPPAERETGARGGNTKEEKSSRSPGKEGRTWEEANGATWERT